jgi:hypothetical protein
MTKGKHSLQEVVGSQTYTTWVEMLRRLVPGGRTHRLAPLVAGMLQYATAVALESAVENEVVMGLQEATEAYDPDEAGKLLLPLIDHLFTDAGVSYRRTNARSQEYSIAEEIVREYVYWFDMPWES